MRYRLYIFCRMTCFERGGLVGVEACCTEELWRPEVGEEEEEEEEEEEVAIVAFVVVSGNLSVDVLGETVGETEATEDASEYTEVVPETSLPDSSALSSELELSEL